MSRKRRSKRKTIYEALGRHPVHPFPARMAPDIALKFISDCKKKLRVLDPMMGSGTVIALARANGHRSFGVDLDPLAVLAAGVWTKSVDTAVVLRKASEVLGRARKRFETLPARRAYPTNTDRESRKFLRYWFDTYSRRQLAALAMTIRRVREPATRNVLWCAFSRMIITKQAGVSLAMDLAHSRPHKSYETAPVKPFNRFLSAVSAVLANCIDCSTRDRGPAPVTKSGDARKLRFADHSIDLVLTSPPYLNAIDYMRCSKFSLIWMGNTAKQLRRTRSQSVGAEVGRYEKDEKSEKIINRLKLSKRLSARHKAILARYIEDMRAAVSEVARVLVPGGKAIYVIGENTIRGTYIKNSKIIEAVANELGLELSDQQRRTLPPNRRYLPPPSSRRRYGKLDTRMRREVILAFRKPLRAKRAQIQKRAA